MPQSRTWWRVAAGAYVFINAGGAVAAGIVREPIHAAMHVGLLLLGFGAYIVWRVAQRSPQPAGIPQTEGRLDYLQQSVDAIAEEIERIGEAQRYNDKLRDERVEPPNKKEQ